MKNLLPFQFMIFMYRFLFIMLFSPILLCAQNVKTGSMSGTIIDAATGALLPNANIILIPSKSGTTADRNGTFSMKNISPGKYSLQASFLGYKTFRKKIEIVADQNLVVEIHLKDSSFSGKEIVIIAEKEKSLMEQTSRISMITADKIQLAPVQGIPDMIDYSPGVSMSNTMGIFSSKAVVTLRGLPSNDQSRTLVLLDGIPLNKSDEGSVNWNLLNKNTIENIKVTKGPGPAKFGSGAMGGVIELKSKRPEKKLEADVSLDYGSYNTLSTNIGVAGCKKDSLSDREFYWRWNGFGRMSDGYITLPDQYRTEADSIVVPVFLKEFNTGIRAGYSFNKRHSVDVRFSYFDDLRGNGIKVFDNYGAYSKHGTYMGSAAYHGRTGLLKWSARIFQTSENYFRIYEYMKDGEYMLYGADSKRQDAGGDAECILQRFLNHEITTGLNYKQGSVDGKDTYYTSTDIISNAAKMETSAFFIQDEMTFFNEKMRINAGLRYDVARYFDGFFNIQYPSYSLEFYKNFESNSLEEKNWNALCPRFSAQYLFSDSCRIYASVARGFRAPILDDMSRTGKKKGGLKIANPDLKPELITTFECGSDFNILKKIMADVSIFYSIGKDFMYYVSNGDSVNMGYMIAPVFQKQNIGKVEIYGAEAELKYSMKDSLTPFLNYTYTHAQIKEHVIRNSLVDSSLTGKYLTDIPSHKISAGISWKNKWLNLSLSLKYLSSTWINELNAIEEEYLKTDKYPGYVTVNIRADKKVIKNLFVSAMIENIFDKKFITSDVQQSPGRFISGSL